MAFLVDINDGIIAPCNPEDPQRLGKSRWFTRGWCLQELIAPSNIHFFDHEWGYLGSKHSLRHLISKITGVDEFSLFSCNLSSVSVSRKMSWAANRETTRVEDMAYCLLGIFDINMPLLYGEGEKAFLRLQEEIIRQTEDHSLFAWHGGAYTVQTSSFNGGVLARHPSAFAKPWWVSHYDAQEFEPANVDPHACKGMETWSVTSRGIRVQLPLLPYHLGVADTDAYLAVLSCREYSSRLALYVRPIEEGSDLFFRGSDGVVKLNSERAAAADKEGLRTIYLLKSDTKRRFDRGLVNHCWLRAMEMTSRLRYHLVDASPRVVWDLNERIMPILQWWSITQAGLVFETSGCDGFALLLCVDPTNETAAIGLFEVDPQQESYVETLLKKFQETFKPQKRATAELEIIKAEAFIVASVEALTIRGKKMFVVDMSVRDRKT